MWEADVSSFSFVLICFLGLSLILICRLYFLDNVFLLGKMCHRKSPNSTSSSASVAKAVAKGLYFGVWIHSARLNNLRLPLNTVELVHKFLPENNIGKFQP